MKYFVRQVDNKNKDIQDVLMGLQLVILDGTKPTKPEIGYWWMVTTEKGEGVGFAAMKQSAQFGDCVFFHRSGIMEEHTGQGLQKRLIKARMRKAKNMGFNWAVSDTTHNPASSNSLINCGFKMYQPSKPWGWKHTCYWRLKLT
jgi:GNAT superfamily N-acetyltransferase